MFTGIVTDVGTVVALEERGDLRARIACAYAPEGIEPGASIACDGVCLTVVDRAAAASDPAAGAVPGARAWFDVDISAETLARTTIGRAPVAWSPGRRVNLERALRVGDELGGHIVTGHVDGIAEILAIEPVGDSHQFRFRAPEALAPLIAPKGSVALNGTSLTVNEVTGAEFTVNVIPHTREVTTWGGARVGDPVNLEVDTLARYVARLLETQQRTSPA